MTSALSGSNINSSFKPTPIAKEPVEAAASGPEEAAIPAPSSKSVPVAEDQPSNGRAVMAVQAFYNEVIEPHKECLSGMLEGINRIVEILEQYGDCPSVVDTIADPEKKAATRVGDILSRVALRDHTFNVARIALRLLKDAYDDPVGYIPPVIIAALGHDLGKIPQLRSQGKYVKADHPLTSVSIVEEIFEKDKDAHWLKMVAKAIGEHHQSATDRLSELLKEADGKARQLEIGQAEKRASLAWEEWFDCRELLRSVGATVNVTQTGRAFRAFSVEDAVYCDPTFLYETVGAMAAEKGIIDIALLRNTDKDRALRRIVESLRKSDALTSELGKAYTTRRYEIQVRTGKAQEGGPCSDQGERLREQGRVRSDQGGRAAARQGNHSAMTPAHFIDYLNPLNYMSHAQYMSLWRVLFRQCFRASGRSSSPPSPSSSPSFLAFTDRGSWREYCSSSSPSR